LIPTVPIRSRKQLKENNQYNSTRADSCVQDSAELVIVNFI